ncbi:MAG: hypothetical protein HY829_14850 [Actinobacteria bacterium]|nr:hypothetical protein [Actinomycetota bacterium]
MARYLVSFPDGAMAHIPDEDWEDVGKAAHAVMRDAKAAGVWIHGGGLVSDVEVSVVSPEGTVSDGPRTGPPVGGFALLDVPSRDDALGWAAKIASGCRCAQEVRELLPDPEA